MRYDNEQLQGQLGYYGITFSECDDVAIMLPEELVLEIIESTNVFDHSRTFALMLDLFGLHSDLFRTDLFITLSKNYSTRTRATLCGLMTIFNYRKFKVAITKINPRLENFVTCSSEGRLISFGSDPIMKSFGITCTPISPKRDTKKVYSRDEIFARSTVMRMRIIIGPLPKADYLAFRFEYPQMLQVDIYSKVSIAKTSAIYAERDFKAISKHVNKSFSMVA
jgi:hypothetical protein